MPIIDAFILGAIVVVFAVFGGVLAWAEFQTRHLAKPARTGERAARPFEPTTPRTKTANMKEVVRS